MSDERWLKMRDRVCPNGHKGKLYRTETWARLLGITGLVAITGILFATLGIRFLPGWFGESWMPFMMSMTALFVASSVVSAIANEFLTRHFACAECGVEVVDSPKPWPLVVKATALFGVVVLVLVGGVLILTVLAAMYPDSMSWLADAWGIIT